MKVPILVFAYNRPVEILRVLRSLENQIDRDKFEVYVFIDGPRDSSDENAVEEVFNVCRGFGDLVCFIYREPKNIGLRKNILKGIEHITETHCSFVVLEDDIVLSDGALSYMHRMLEVYKDSPTIGHINLWNFPVINTGSPYVSWHMHCWGWGSWTRLWKSGVQEELLIKPSIASKLLISKLFSTTHFSHYYANVVGIKHTWAVLWMMRLVRLRLRSISPPYSLVENIGLDNGDNVEYISYKQKLSSNKNHPTVVASSISGFFVDFVCWFYTFWKSPKLSLFRSIYLIIFK